MVRITEELIRKRSEHNECLITTLEELSLHQQDIERIEYLDKWCRDLKILYLQSNLIPKIENVGRLKKLEYLNLALNNIEKIENLQGCESLTKLDLTVNFVAELTDVETLRNHCHLRELFLTGNPCTEYEGYRDYVIATLPQLKYLDGVEIEKSERILATQKLHEIRPEIVIQQKKYLAKREKEKLETDFSSNVNQDSGDTELDEAEAEKRFWNEKVPFTPESRIRLHQHQEEQKEKRESKSKSEKIPKRERKLQADDGRMVNVNEPKVDFTLEEDETGKCIVLDVAVFRFLETEFCDADVQPTYVRVIIKGKILQIVLPEEVHPLQSTAKRSQITGHLVITMPKVNSVLTAKTASYLSKKKILKEASPKTSNATNNRKSNEFLEVDPSHAKPVDFTNIVSTASKSSTSYSSLLLKTKTASTPAVERPNSADFVDDADVPPLI